MAELLALADPESGRAVARPPPRLHRAGPGHPPAVPRSPALYESTRPVEVARVQRCRGGHFVAANVMFEPGDHAIVVWPSLPEPSRGRARRRRGRDVCTSSTQGNGWAIDVEAAASPRSPPEDAPRRRQRAAQPDGLPPGRRDVPGRWPRIARGRLRHPPVRRGLPLPRGRPDRPPAGGCRLSDRRASRVGVMSKSFALAGLRIGWLVTLRRAVCWTRRPGSRTTRRSAPSAPAEILALVALRAREGRPRAVAVDRYCLTSRSLDGFFERQAGALPLGSPGWRLDRLPRAAGRRCRSTASPRTSSRRRACCSRRGRSSGIPATTSGWGSAGPTDGRRSSGSRPSLQRTLG